MILKKINKLQQQKISKISKNASNQELKNGMTSQLILINGNYNRGGLQPNQLTS